jgi:KDO2-lipid IV(A) lauroyltransferase
VKARTISALAGPVQIPLIPSMPPLSKRIKRSLLYYAALGAIWFLNLVPRKMALFVGRQFGLLAWRMIPRDRANIDRNLSFAFGERYSAEQRQEIGRQFFINSGKNLVDVIRFRKHYACEIAPLVEVEGLEHFDRAFKAGRGLIGITGHLGNFELLAVHIVAMGYPSAAIGRELYDPRLNALLVRNRTAMGLVNIATTDSPKKILQWLKDGKVLGVLMDTDSMRVRNIFAPFFGHPAATPVSLSAIGLRVGAAFVPIACVRIDGDRYKVVIMPALEIQRSGDDEKDLLNITSLCNKALEDIITRFPDQWIWLHNRWNAKPQNTP